MSRLIQIFATIVAISGIVVADYVPNLGDIASCNAMPNVNGTLRPYRDLTGDMTNKRCPVECKRAAWLTGVTASNDPSLCCCHGEPSDLRSNCPAMKKPMHIGETEAKNACDLCEQGGYNPFTSYGLCCCQRTMEDAIAHINRPLPEGHEYRPDEADFASCNAMPNGQQILRPYRDLTGDMRNKTCSFECQSASWQTGFTANNDESLCCCQGEPSDLSSNCPAMTYPVHIGEAPVMNACDLCSESGYNPFTSYGLCCCERTMEDAIAHINRPAPEVDNDDYEAHKGIESDEEDDDPVRHYTW